MTEIEQASGWSMWSWLRWKPTSVRELVEAERRILSNVSGKFESAYVSIQNNAARLWTVWLNKNSKATPLVLLHGMGAGVGLWALNLEALSEKRPVYAMDILGFGRSSRPHFSSDALLAEMEFVDSIEEWRKELKLDKFILLGHSLGGFIAAAYALRYPDRIKHLILCDPWGFPEKPLEGQRHIPFWIKAIATMLKPFNPLAGLRAAGPYGPRLVERFRPDITSKFDNIYTDDTVSNYIYHCNAQSPSGEVAFKSMNTSFGWAKYPMVLRIKELHPEIPLTMVYGSRSWINRDTGFQIKYLRTETPVNVQVIKGAGHHVYADQSGTFNAIIKSVCDEMDDVHGDDEPFEETAPLQPVT